MAAKQGDMAYRRRAPARTAALLVALALVGTACQPGGSGGTAAGTSTTTAPPPATTSTVPPVPSTTTAPPTTTTTIAPDPGPLPTTTVPGGGGGTGELALKDTGLTRLQVDVSSRAAWITLRLNGTTIKLSKVLATSGNTRVTGLGGSDIALWGDGTASIDLVLAVPQGAATYLSLCKNYLGPASITLTRRTEAPTPILSYTATGSDPSAASGCENYAQAPLDRSSLIGPVRWPARRDPRPLVLANFYPWYDPTTLQTSFGDQPTGPANTNDPAVVQQAVDLARGSGIDGFVIEYEGSPANEPRIRYAYDAADARPGFNAALLIDLDVLSRRSGGLTVQSLDAALQEVAAYAGRSSQLRMGDQPVVFLYGAARVTPVQWNAAVERLRAATGLQPFVIPDDAGLGIPARYLYSTNNVSDDQLAQWSDAELTDLQLRPAFDGWSPGLWVAPVSPGYDDTRLGRPSPMVTDREGGARYDRTWQAAVGSLPDWIIISSWNEYYEQTHVAPGTTTGTRALDQTARWAASFDRTG